MNEKFLLIIILIFCLLFSCFFIFLVCKYARMCVCYNFLPWNDGCIWAAASIALPALVYAFFSYLLNNAQPSTVPLRIWCVATIIIGCMAGIILFIKNIRDTYLCVPSMAFAISTYFIQLFIACLVMCSFGLFFLLAGFLVQNLDDRKSE